MAISYGNSVLVYDVGGSHVSAAVCCEKAFQLDSIVSECYPAEPTGESFLEFLFELGAKARNGTGNVLGAELAFPGPFDYETGVSRMEHKLPYLLGVDLRTPLAQRFGFAPGRVRFLNDAVSYLLGEVGAGAAKGVPRCVGITLGTGIGSAFAVDGQIVTTGPGVPPRGEIWDLPFAGGIVEDALSTRALQNDYEKRTGTVLEVSKIAALAGEDPHAAAVFAGFGSHLGVALRTLMATFAPQVVVLGGGIARSAHLFLPQAQKELNETTMELRIAQLFDHAPLVGAAVAWFDREARG